MEARIDNYNGMQNQASGQQSARERTLRPLLDQLSRDVSDAELESLVLFETWRHGRDACGDAARWLKATLFNQMVSTPLPDRADALFDTVLSTGDSNRGDNPLVLAVAVIVLELRCKCPEQVPESAECPETVLWAMSLGEKSCETAVLLAQYLIAWEKDYLGATPTRGQLAEAVITGCLIATLYSQADTSACLRAIEGLAEKVHQLDSSIAGRVMHQSLVLEDEKRQFVDMLMMSCSKYNGAGNALQRICESFGYSGRSME